MKRSIVLSLVYFSMVAFSSSAHADGYICDVVGGGDVAGIGSEISVGIYNGTLEVGGSDADGNPYMKGATGTLDSSYHPRADHAGATRYLISGDACGETGDAAIVDQDMITKGNGFLTFSLGCDADGGSPSFQVYSCQVQ